MYEVYLRMKTREVSVSRRALHEAIETHDQTCTAAGTDPMSAETRPRSIRLRRSKFHVQPSNDRIYGEAGHISRGRKMPHSHS